MNFIALGVGLALLCGAIFLNKMHVRQSFAYIFIGTLMWVAFLKSGVHATIAALLMAFSIPARTRINGESLIQRIRLIAARLEAIGVPANTELNTPEQQHMITSMSNAIEHATAPLQRIEEDLHGPVIFVVLPVFALANAGVTLGGDIIGALTSSLALGVAAGLFVGKQIGITLTTWLAVKARIADLPRGVTWKHIHGVNILGGIGFTMSLFVSGLAFSNPEHIEIAKIGILVGSIVSGIVGYLYLSRLSAHSHESHELVHTSFSDPDASTLRPAEAEGESRPPESFE